MAFCNGDGLIKIHYFTINMNGMVFNIIILQLQLKVKFKSWKNYVHINLL